MDDVIYKQAAIDAKQEFRNPNVVRSTEARTAYDRTYANGWNDCNSAWIDVVKDLPPAQPEQRWIPCSERLPEDSQFVLMTIRRMDKHYNHEPFISIGYISWNQSAWWCAHDGDCKSNDVRVDAWMPLPEPYQKGAGK